MFIGQGGITLTVGLVFISMEILDSNSDMVGFALADDVSKGRAGCPLRYAGDHTHLINDYT